MKKGVIVVKKLLMFLVTACCLLMAGTGTVLASDANRIVIPEGVEEFVYLGEQGIMITKGIFQVPDNDAEFMTAAGYIVTKGIVDYGKFYDQTVSVKNFKDPSAKGSVKATPEKPAVYFRVPIMLNGEPFQNYAPVLWWPVSLQAGVDQRGFMYYVDQEGNLLDQPLRKTVQLFARTEFDMSLGKMSFEFDPRAALDYLQLTPPGIAGRTWIAEDLRSVKVTPSISAEVPEHLRDIVTIERLDGKDGAVMFEVDDGKLTADKWYRITNKK